VNLHMLVENCVACCIMCWSVCVSLQFVLSALYGVNPDVLVRGTLHPCSEV
jgi:hypothetical protein